MNSRGYSHYSLQIRQTLNETHSPNYTLVMFFFFDMTVYLRNGNVLSTCVHSAKVLKTNK